jgi:uncharacterized membrane protein
MTHLLKVLGTGSLVAATLVAGLFAGIFYAFSMAVMPALAEVDAHTMITSMQAMIVAIINPWFMLCLVGAPLLMVAAAVLNAMLRRRHVVWWIVAAFVLYVVVVGVTAAVSIPLNDALVAAGPPERITDVAAVRRRFEAPWAQWNVVRAVAATASFGCLVWATRRSGYLTGRERQ